MSKRKSKLDKAHSRLKRLEHKLRKLKPKLDKVHRRSKKLVVKVADVEKGTKIVGKTAGDAGLLIAVKSREFANTAVALQARMVELESGLHKLSKQRAQENLSSEIEQESAARLGVLEANMEHLVRKVADAEQASEAVQPRLQANEDSVKRLAETIDGQDRRIDEALGEQDAMNAQIQRVSRLHEQLQGDYENLDEMSTDQLASLISRLETLESADQTVETKLAQVEQKIDQVPTEQLTSVVSKIDALETSDPGVQRKLSEFEEKLSQIAADSSASLMSKNDTLEKSDPGVEEKLAKLEDKISEISADPSASLMSKIDALEADDQAIESQLSEFEQKTSDMATLVESLESGLVAQERSMEDLKGELAEVTNTAAQTQERTLRLESQGQDHAASLNNLKTDVSRQGAMQENLSAVQGDALHGSGELDKKIEELGKAKDALWIDTNKQSANLETLSSSLNIRSWVLGGLSLLAIAAVLLTFLYTQGQIASNRDVFYAELAAIEHRPAEQEHSVATGTSVIRELKRLNTSMAKLAKLESKPWPRDPEVKLVQRDVAELAEEISSLNTRMDEMQRNTDVFRADIPKVPVASSASGAGVPSGSAGDSNEFTIQLIGSFRKSSITRFASEHEIAREAKIFELQHQGKPWFVLLYGRYTSFQKAFAELNSLPQTLRDNKAWIRYLPRSL